MSKQGKWFVDSHYWLVETWNRLTFTWEFQASRETRRQARTVARNLRLIHNHKRVHLRKVKVMMEEADV